MSTGEGRKVTIEEIDKVKNLIEGCILNYKTKKETINVLYQEHNIEPCFTNIIWKHLAEQNQRFFQNYRLRLVLIDQMTRLNDLLKKQAAMMSQLNPNEVAAAFPPNNHNLAEQPHGLNNDGSLTMQHSYDSQCNTMLAQNQNGGIIEHSQNQNGGMMEHSQINNESGALGNSASSSNMDPNPHPDYMDDFSPFLSTHPDYMDDLSPFLSPHPDYTVFGIMGRNQGVLNTSSNLDFQNSGFAEMAQTSNVFS